MRRESRQVGRNIKRFLKKVREEKGLV